MVTARSVEGVIVVAAEAELLAVLGSAVVALTLAVLVTVPAVVGAVALMVMVALLPEARVPTLQVTVPELLAQVPCVELAETKVSPEGRVSVTVTPEAGLGPLFLGVRV